jgi:hypothetical protein
MVGAARGAGSTAVTSAATTPAADDVPAGDAVSASEDMPADGATDEPAPAAARTRRRVWLFVGLVAVGYVVQAAWRCWLIRNVGAPVAHADEDAYLVAARALAGGPGGGTSENRLFRRLGYPLLLSPIYWFNSDAFTVYRAAQVANALLNALTFPLAVLFARRVCGLARGWAVAAGFVAALLPAVAFFGQFAMPEVVLPPLGLAWLILLHRWLTIVHQRDRAGWHPRSLAVMTAGAAAGLVAGFSSTTHVRGTVVALVHAGLALVLLTRWRSRPSAIASLLATITAMGLEVVLRLSIRGEIHTWGDNAKGQSVEAFITAGGLVRMLDGGVGQVWYLAVGTVGLGAVGLVAAVARLGGARAILDRLRGGGPVAADLVALAALTTTVLVAFGSSAALPPGDLRINYFAYARYLYFLFPAWALLGVAALRSAPRPHAVRLAVAAALLTVGAGTVVYLRVSAARGYRLDPIDSPELGMLTGQWTTLPVVVPTVVALAALAVLALALRRPYPAVAAGVALAVAATVGMSVAKEHVIRPRIAGQYLPDTPRLVRDVGLGPGDVVAYTIHQDSYEFRFNHMREVYWTRIQYFDQRTEAPPARADVVIAPLGAKKPGIDWDGTRYGYRLIATDPVHHWAVWRRD